MSSLIGLKYKKLSSVTEIKMHARILCEIMLYYIAHIQGYNEYSL